MASLLRGYEVFFANVQATITPAIIREGTRRAARAAIRVIQDRTDRGIGQDGQPFAERSSRYMAYKAGHLRKTRGTRFKAKSPEDWMRFSGRLYSAMYVRSVNARKSGSLIEGGFELDIKGDAERKKADGLITGKLGRGNRPPRRFWGLALPGTSQRRAEDREVLRAFTDYVAVRLPKGIVINR